jgi:hypothetical protein
MANHEILARVLIWRFYFMFIFCLQSSLFATAGWILNVQEGMETEGIGTPKSLHEHHGIEEVNSLGPSAGKGFFYHYFRVICSNIIVTISVIKSGPILWTKSSLQPCKRAYAKTSLLRVGRRGGHRNRQHSISA